MAPATEIVFLPLKVGEKYDDPSTPEGQKYGKMLQEILANDGAQGSLFWGRQHENPAVANAFINWDSIGHHQKFIESP